MTASRSSPTGPRARPGLDVLPAYTPGRAPAPRPGITRYKLSSNETPLGPLPSVRAVLEAEAGVVNRYPDMSCAALYDALAARFDVPTGDIAAATGSVAVLYHLVQALCEPGDEVVYAWRSFEAYPIAALAAAARGVQVPLGPGARHDLDAMADAITDRTRMVLACTPNNPTGPAIGAAELEAFLDRVPERVLVVVDAAYAEFVTDPAAADELAAYRARPNVAVLRTFSKAYGLAGLRVGFMLARDPIAAAVRKVALPFGVSGMAQAAAVASLQPAAEAELLDRVRGVVAERGRVLAGLEDAGWAVPDTQANFVWLPLEHDAVPFAAACEQEGVSVRPFAGDGVRVTVAEPAASDVFLDVARRWSTRP